MFEINNRNDVLSRFNTKYVVDKESECWNWTAASRGNDYGCLKIDGKVVDAHRVSYMLFIGDIPDDMCICHKCDNKHCVNPQHLFLGTRDDNNQDMIRKGRMAIGERHGARLHPEKIARGERQGSHKLTEENVKLILKKYYFENEKVSTMVRLFNVNKTTIYSILRGENWGNIYLEVMGNIPSYQTP